MHLGIHMQAFPKNRSSLSTLNIQIIYLVHLSVPFKALLVGAVPFKTYPPPHSVNANGKKTINYNTYTSRHFFYTNHPKIIELPTTELRWMHSQVDKIAH